MNPLVGFGGSIARNCGEMQILSSWNCSAHWPGVVNDCVLEALFCENLRTPRAKCSFWNLLLLNVEDASHETIILEALFYEIWKKPRTKRSFWKFLLLNVEDASHETIILEALFYEIWKEPRTKRSFWKLCSMKFGRSLARNDHVGTFVLSKL